VGGGDQSGKVKSIPWSDAQEDQLRNARAVALKNRRIRAKAKLEQRLAELRAALGDDISTPQMEKMVLKLIDTENHHRSKLAQLQEQHTQELADVKACIRKATAPRESVAPKIRAPSTVGSVASSYASL
jgi:cysteinyl-tRNA synthetase